MILPTLYLCWNRIFNVNKEILIMKRKMGHKVCAWSAFFPIIQDYRASKGRCTLAKNDDDRPCCLCDSAFHMLHCCWSWSKLSGPKEDRLHQCIFGAASWIVSSSAPSDLHTRAVAAVDLIWEHNNAKLPWPREEKDQFSTYNDRNHF